MLRHKIGVNITVMKVAHPDLNVQNPIKRKVRHKKIKLYFVLVYLNRMQIVLIGK